MSGHSKWATTKHRKAAQDAKRSALFSKLARNITVAAKEGGDPNPDNNASLAAAIEKAKGYSMPKDKIKTAIDKAFGSGKDAANYETVVYEGYGPAGVAVLCEALTDNRNRTAADVRAAFSHSGGNLGTSGSVAFQFDRKGQIMVSKEVETGDKKNPIGPNGAAADEEEFMLAVAEAGGDDYEDADEEWIVYTAPGDLMAVVKELEAQGIQVKGAEMTMIANTPSAVSVADAKKVMRLIDKLEELEDLQAVYHTMDITDEIAEALGLVCAADIGLLSIEYTCSDGENTFAQTLTLTATGVNTAKLDQLERFVKRFPLDGVYMTADDLHTRLDEIAQAGGSYTPLQQGLAAALACGGFTFLLGGGPIEMLLAFLGAGVGQYVRARPHGQQLPPVHVKKA